MEVDQQKSNSRDHSPVIQLLNQGDQLTQRFQKQFNDSITHVQTLNSSLQQHDNLSNLAARSGEWRSTPNIHRSDKGRWPR
ncbi:hypothetical protein H4Q26_003485 [Puccinia striiformis f. sp. tritici PST-130]|nr:hypothetical protein H4Q26_003485 [Puccinia striiformis f. sp. tritici PST-130]